MTALLMHAVPHEPSEEDCCALALQKMQDGSAGSLEEYHKVAVEGRDEKLSAETAWLREEKIGLVVSDVVPLACAAACAARIPSVCVSNFSWGVPFPLCKPFMPSPAGSLVQQKLPMIPSAAVDS